MLTPEQIQQYRSQYGVPSPTTQGASVVGKSLLDATTPTPETTLIGDFARALLRPVAQSGIVRPYQAVKAGISYLQDPMKTPDLDVNLPFLGKFEEPTTMKAEFGNAAKTVALGLGPVSGSATFGLGDALENDRSATATALEVAAAALGGKIMDVGFQAAMPYIQKAVAKYGPDIIQSVAKVLPPSAKAGLSKVAGIAESVTEKQILPKFASSAINKGATALESGMSDTIGAVARPFTDAAGKTISGIKNKASEYLGGRAVSTTADDVVQQAAKDSATPAGIRASAEAATSKPDILERWAGIRPDIKNRIAGKGDKLKEYFDVAHARNNFDTLPTPLEHGAKNVETAVSEMDKLIQDTGSKIGQFRKKVSTYQAPRDSVVAVESRFANELERLNLEVKGGVVRQKPGTVQRVNTEGEIKVLNALYGELQTVKQAPTLERLIDLRNLFDSRINFAKQARDVSSSLDPLSRSVRKEIADVSARIVGKSEAANLKEYSAFMDAYNDLRSYSDRKAGAEFLLKQVLSERGGTPREVIETIKKYTGIDLMDDAVMSQIATEVVGNAAQKGVFRQEVTKAGLDAMKLMTGDASGAFDTLLTGIKHGLVNEEKQFMKAAGSKPQPPKAQGEVPPMTSGPGSKTSSATRTDLPRLMNEQGGGGAALDPAVAESLRAMKGLSAEDIIKKNPDIQLKRDVPATDIHGNKVVIPEGEALTPYELKGNKILLQDGQTYIVSKNQYANIKGNAISGEAKPFAPELAGTEETVKANWKEKQADIFARKDAGTITKEQMNAELDALGNNQTPTKYSQYQLPGGENYKEVLIKAPDTKSMTLAEFSTEAKRGGLSNESVIKSKYQEYLKDGAGTDISKSQNFKSSHWDEPNVISHIRLNERTYNGKKVTFMEELQSDWAREARAGKTTATAPQLKNWQELSVKRALKEAVDNNSEYFAWINGEQTAARYNLSTQVKKINWFDPSTAQTGRKTVVLEPQGSGKRYEFDVNKEGIITAIEDGTPNDWKGKNIAEVIGKGVGERIVSSPKGTLEGEGLNIGGEWAKNLYDKQVKSIVEDLTGAKVEMMDLGLPVDKAATQLFKGESYFKKSFDNYDTPLKVEDLKVGQTVRKGVGRESSPYIITDILGDGKFKAVPKNSYYKEIYDPAKGIENTYKKARPDSELTQFKETFDISTKKSTQQGIRLTPEIKARVKGEAPTIKASGKEPFQKTDPLLSEARKYKTAEEFVNSFNLMKSGEVTSIGQLPIGKVNKTQIKSITERGLPHTDTNLKVKDFTPGRKVTQPLEVYSKGNSYVVENGNHRLAQALANGDTHIPVVFKRGEGKSYTTHTKSQLTDLWKQAQQGMKK